MSCYIVLKTTENGMLTLLSWALRSRMKTTALELQESRGFNDHHSSSYDTWTSLADSTI